jgi:hypothetical protein
LSDHKFRFISSRKGDIMSKRIVLLAGVMGLMGSASLLSGDALAEINPGILGREVWRGGGFCFQNGSHTGEDAGTIVNTCTAQKDWVVPLPGCTAYASGIPGCQVPYHIKARARIHGNNTNYTQCRIVYTDDSGAYSTTGWESRTSATWGTTNWLDKGPLTPGVGMAFLECQVALQGGGTRGAILWTESVQT